MTLNGIDISTYHITPGRAPDSDTAFSGLWDFPERINKVYNSWGDEPGIDPLTGEEEIMFGGRDIIFHGIVKGDNRQDSTAKVYAFYKAISQFTGLVPLVTDWGTAEVYVKAGIEVNYLSSGWAEIKITFREPVPDLSGTIPAEEDAEFGIDKISFETLGLHTVALRGRMNRPETKEPHFTAFEEEGYQLTKTAARGLIYRVFLNENNYAALKGRITTLYALFSQSKTNVLSLPGDTLREFIVDKGFKVVKMFAQGPYWCEIEIPLTEIRNGMEDLDWLADYQGDPILNSDDGLIFVDPGEGGGD